MFTGIIEDQGRVEQVEKRSGLLRLKVRSKILIDQKIGDSISINGVCLTITELNRDTACFDVMSETLKKSTIKSLKQQDLVNLERALRVGDRVGGHFVTGHIDCVGTVVEASGLFKVKISKENMKYLVHKGSIAIDGISLTVAALGREDFSVYLIPHTLKSTTLGSKKKGSEINIEFDMLGKYALSNKKTKPTSNITKEFLKQKGFS